MNPRRAAALLASAIENRVLLKPGALLPRRLTVDNVEYVIENGAGRDMISSGMISLADATPTKEVLQLTELGFRFTIATFNAELLVDADVLLPSSE